MGNIAKRGRLSPAERAEVHRLGRTGNHSSRDLASRFGVGKSTILRVLRGQGVPVDPRGPAQTIQEEPKPRPKRKAAATVSAPPKPPPEIETSEPLPPPRPAPAEIPKDPILYREHKLREIVHDMAQTRQRGSMHVLPQFHRLEMSIHDELGKMRQEAAEITAEMGADGLVSTIVSTMHRLPPVLRHRIQEQLEALTTGAVVVLPGVAEEAGDEDGEEYG